MISIHIIIKLEPGGFTLNYSNKVLSLSLGKGKLYTKTYIKFINKLSIIPQQK